MLRYRRLQIFVAAALALVMAIGLGGTLTPSHEIFPFASWFLFSLVPGRRSEFEVILRVIDNKPVEPGRPFRQADFLVHHPHSIVIHEIIQKLGAAEEARDAKTSRALRRQIEGEFDPAISRYDLVRVTYKPVERWKTGRVQDTAVVRSFATGEN